MKQRLQVFLSHAGIASRRKSAEIIERGKVWVNGVCIRERGFSVDPEKDRVEINGKPIKSEKKVYFILNKPKGYVTSLNDEHGRKTVMELVPKMGSRIYPIGRLDKDTEGVLILTNDGELAHKLMHPSYEVNKVYTAEVLGELTLDNIKRLERGVFIEGIKTAPCKINVVFSDREKTVIRIEIHEGRKRQIRRMLKRVGCTVTTLVRNSYAGITAKHLPLGAFRNLSQHEINLLKSSCEIKRV